jgi:energy-coupling factor transporter ATP-binding protein EcfA2
MSAVLTELSKWVAERPYWEQAALDQIISGVPFSETDHQQLILLALEDKDLADKTTSRPPLKLSQFTQDGQAPSSVPARLHSISNLENVNALAAGQTLPFSRALTVVYGANGSGKSGYARVLGCAGFTRGDREVLHDVNQPLNAEKPRTAEIWIEMGESVTAIHYEVGKDCPELRPFYAFDSTSVAVHLTKPNRISFTPAGLAYLTSLSKLVDDCNEKLKLRVAPALQQHCFGILFKGNTTVARLMADLGPKTNEKELQKLALAPEEQEQITELELRIARLKSQDTAAQIAKIRQEVEDLRQLTKVLQAAGKVVDDCLITEINTTIEAIAQEQEIAKSFSIDQFSTPLFSQTGSSTWRHFIEAAQNLAVAENSQYPSEQDHCLLCHQSLSDEARDRLYKLWAFLKDTSQMRLIALRGELDNKRRSLIDAKIDPFDESQVSYRLLLQYDQSLIEVVTAFLAAVRARREAVMQASEAVAVLSSATLPDSGTAGIERIMSELQTQAAGLEDGQTGNKADEIAALESQLLDLKHRALLWENLAEISQWLDKRKWAEKANKAIGTTTHISRKYDELFKRLVTDEYLNVFAGILKDLKCPLKIRLKTRTQKGEPYKNIVLEADAPADKAEVKAEKVEKVLSEGEKRAVALADFLTEVALDENSCGVILDDPVTSLDWEWKEVVAKRLVTEARNRQVIIFTHDLHFLYLIKKHADGNDMELASHLITRAGEDGRPGYVYPDGSPATEGDHRSPELAMKYWRRAKEASSPIDQESILESGFSCLRRSYEALIVYDIFGKVVTRFEARISVDRLKEVVADGAILEQVMEKYGGISRFVGHLPTDDSLAHKPSLEILKREIDDYTEIRRKIAAIKKERQK